MACSGEHALTGRRGPPPPRCHTPLPDFTHGRGTAMSEHGIRSQLSCIGLEQPAQLAEFPCTGLCASIQPWQETITSHGSRYARTQHLIMLARARNNLQGVEKQFCCNHRSSTPPKCQG